jgi:hypothetical protein
MPTIIVFNEDRKNAPSRMRVDEEPAEVAEALAKNPLPKLTASGDSVWVNAASVRVVEAPGAGAKGAAGAAGTKAGAGAAGGAAGKAARRAKRAARRARRATGGETPKAAEKAATAEKSKAGDKSKADEKPKS